MSWYSPPSILEAFHEADRLWPRRSKGADGTIGDAAHQARSSDHNPDARGCIHAFDVTAALTPGGDTPYGNVLVDVIIARRDPRVAYLIWNHGIWDGVPFNGQPAWTRHDYHGQSAHTEHVHVSIWSDLNERELGHGDSTLRDASEIDTSAWWIGVAPVPTPGTAEEEEVMIVVEPGQEVPLAVLDKAGKIQVSNPHPQAGAVYIFTCDDAGNESNPTGASVLVAAKHADLYAKPAGHVSVLVGNRGAVSLAVRDRYDVA